MAPGPLELTSRDVKVWSYAATLTWARSAPAAPPRWAGRLERRAAGLSVRIPILGRAGSGAVSADPAPTSREDLMISPTYPSDTDDPDGFNYTDEHDRWRWCEGASVRRVRKLLAHAEEPSRTPPERAAFRARAERIAEGYGLPLEAFIAESEPPPFMSWSEGFVAGQHYSSGPPPWEPPATDDPWRAAPPAGYHYEASDPFGPSRLVSDEPWHSAPPAGYHWETNPFDSGPPRLVKDRGPDDPPF